MSLPTGKHRVTTALSARGQLVPALWFLAAYIGVVILALWLGRVLPAPHPSDIGWSD